MLRLVVFRAKIIWIDYSESWCGNIISVSHWIISDIGSGFAKKLSTSPSLFSQLKFPAWQFHLFFYLYFTICIAWQDDSQQNWYHRHPCCHNHADWSIRLSNRIYRQYLTGNNVACSTVVKEARKMVWFEIVTNHDKIKIKKLCNFTTLACIVHPYWLLLHLWRHRHCTHLHCYFVNQKVGFHFVDYYFPRLTDCLIPVGDEGRYHQGQHLVKRKILKLWLTMMA